jgi:hypothetical protein
MVLKIKKGKILTQFNAHQVIVDSCRMEIGEIGVLLANGDINIDDESFRFDTKQKNVLAQELAQFLSVERPTQGLIEAHSQLSGSFAEKEQNILIDSKGKIIDGLIEEITLTKETRFECGVNLLFNKTIEISKAKFVDDTGLNLTFRGTRDLIKESLALSFDLALPHANRYILFLSKSET